MKFSPSFTGLVQQEQVFPAWREAHCPCWPCKCKCKKEKELLRGKMSGSGWLAAIT